MTGSEINSQPREAVGGFDRAGTAWVFALFAVGGVGLGVLLPWLARWVGDLPWAPFKGPLELLGSFDQTWLVWGRPVIGLLAGLGFALWVVLDSAVLAIGPEDIQVLRRGQVERVIQRRNVDSAHRRGSKVVIETAQGRRLFEGDVEGDKSTVRDAFIAADYPWEGPPD